MGFLLLLASLVDSLADGNNNTCLHSCRISMVVPQRYGVIGFYALSTLVGECMGCKVRFVSYCLPVANLPLWLQL